MREGVVRLLTEAGFEVRAQAGDAEDLLRKALAHHPDVVITDVQMPPGRGDDGLRAALELRRRRPETGVLVLSHYYEEAYALELIGKAPRASDISSRSALATSRSSPTPWPGSPPEAARSIPRSSAGCCDATPREGSTGSVRATSTCWPSWPRESRTGGSPRRWSSATRRSRSASRASSTRSASPPSGPRTGASSRR